MKLTSELIENKGWELSTSELDKKIDTEFGWKTYKLTVYDNVNRSFPMTLKYGASNYVNRDWSLHVDNDYYETIGSCDLETTEQFNKFMEALEIDYKL